MLRSVSVLLAATLVAAAPALAQVQRLFPYQALRGEIAFDAPPTVRLNGQTTQLAPGAHIRDAQNMGIVFGALEGTKAVVNYTVDQLGQPKEIWVLTADEAARKPWPRTDAERQAWQFDYVAQTWTRP
ncbi:hypothetical protein KAK07_13960 [Ideonella sp. 4Y16]|uniref:Uncharacterized protein n=1 Tax=Ideonella alba TaxID=2824118 RepID=A0A940YCU2_9BURK|nr:hypothetical protein [Ideonella alba]MBQ0932290.1 hypothetical protein [Ideonella alba]MBQ0944440.1 hypothetical protein [Ideonella alba]